MTWRYGAYFIKESRMEYGLAAYDGLLSLPVSSDRAPDYSWEGVYVCSLHTGLGMTISLQSNTDFISSLEVRGQLTAHYSF